MADLERQTFTPVTIRARDIAPPSTISPAAQQALSDGAALPRTQYPAPDDLDAWRAFLSAGSAMRDQMVAPMLAGVTAQVETRSIAGVTCHDCVPAGGAAPDGPVYLYIHGGAFVFGGGLFAKALGARGADALGLRVVSVDYRMPPDHPFPAAPEDCVAVYKALLETVDPARIVIGGGSAGGNLAAAATLMIRDRGLPMPAGVILLTPEVDLTESGDSFRTNEDLDIILKRGLPECNALYAGGHDLTDPYLSPLFADFTRGFPPALVQSGTRDLFLSNSVLIHRKLREAGVDAELHVWEAMPHGAFSRGETPESAQVNAEVARFIRRVTSGPGDRQLEANKRLVLDMWHTVINGRDYAKAGQYIAPDYIQHSPSAGQGLEVLIEFLKWELGEGPLEPGSYELTRFEHVLAEGDLVQLMFQRHIPDPAQPERAIPVWWYDTYRVKDGLIVEHWDSALE
jgi:acetyl esterase/lipase/predicted SnoaL-like aldol condensation-catalyzing enzyme